MKTESKKKQATFSLPLNVSKDLDTLFEENKEVLSKLGIHTRTGLLVAVYLSSKDWYKKKIIDTFNEIYSKHLE